MDELNYQIRRIAPRDGLFGAVWQTHSASIWNNACFTNVDAFIEAVRGYPLSSAVKNLYVTHATFKEPDLAKPRNPPRFDRRIVNFHSTLTLVIDGDVKPGAFASTAECKQALCAMLAEVGLKPSFIVLTGAPLDLSRPVETSGMHLYLTMSRAPSLEDWKAMALDLVAILKHRGLVFDTGVTTDPVRILRPCGSLNRKTDETRIARLDLESINGPDYDPDELRSILARVRPPGRVHNSPPSDHAHIDLAEVASAADYLLEHGHYGPGCYFHLRDLFFGLAQLVHERPELHDDIRLLFERIAVATGRDHAKAMSWFDGAVARAPSYADQDRITLASTFAYALRMGWRPPRIEDRLEPGQHHKLYGFRRRLAEIFADGHDRIEAAKGAARMATRIGDERVLTALAPSLAFHLARDDWNESTILDAIECATGRRDVGLARWAQRLRGSTT
jgi:hypothetical protein